jgi:tetratricopeptide (TPR) repeat protein
MRRMPLRLLPCVIGPALFASAAAPSRAQIPDTFENLQYFPKDIPRDSLLQRMRGFSFALGVRCQHCHAGGNGISFQGVQFASDEKAAKRNARFMLRMVDSLNAHAFEALPERSNPPVRLECVTCHRGSSPPTTLAATLRATIDAKGIDSAVAQYRELRKDMASGRFDLGEWSMNELARTLSEQGKKIEAIAILELNAEFYPDSPAIGMALGDLYRERGDRDKALERYRQVLERQPNNPVAKRRVDELTRAPRI